MVNWPSEQSERTNVFWGDREKTADGLYITLTLFVSVFCTARTLPLWLHRPTRVGEVAINARSDISGCCIRWALRTFRYLFICVWTFTKPLENPHGQESAKRIEKHQDWTSRGKTGHSKRYTDQHEKNQALHITRKKHQRDVKTFASMCLRRFEEWKYIPAFFGGRVVQLPSITDQRYHHNTTNHISSPNHNACTLISARKYYKKKHFYFAFLNKTLRTKKGACSGGLPFFSSFSTDDLCHKTPEKPGVWTI